jgi:hypothetical protein
MPLSLSHSTQIRTAMTHAPDTAAPRPLNACPPRPSLHPSAVPGLRPGHCPHLTTVLPLLTADAILARPTHPPDAGRRPCPHRRSARAPSTSAAPCLPSTRCCRMRLLWPAIACPCSLLLLPGCRCEEHRPGQAGARWPSTIARCHTNILRPKPDAHHMYAQDQVVIHTARM